MALGSRSDLPPLHNDILSVPRVLVSQNAEEKTLIFLLEALKSCADSEKKFRLFIVTYNVGTLGPKDSRSNTYVNSWKHTESLLHVCKKHVPGLHK